MDFKHCVQAREMLGKQGGGHRNPTNRGDPAHKKMGPPTYCGVSATGRSAPRFPSISCTNNPSPSSGLKSFVYMFFVLEYQFFKYSTFNKINQIKKRVGHWMFMFMLVSIPLAHQNKAFVYLFISNKWNLNCMQNWKSIKISRVSSFGWKFPKRRNRCYLSLECKSRGESC